MRRRAKRADLAEARAKRERRLAGCQGWNSQLPDHGRLKSTSRNAFTLSPFGARSATLRRNCVRNLYTNFRTASADAGNEQPIWHASLANPFSPSVTLLDVVSYVRDFPDVPCGWAGWVFGTSFDPGSFTPPERRLLSFGLSSAASSTRVTPRSRTRSSLSAREASSPMM
jgi:hypothetical protein